MRPSAAGSSQFERLEGDPLFLSDVPLWLRLFGGASFLTSAVLLAIATRSTHRFLTHVAEGRPFTPGTTSDVWRASKALMVSCLLTMGLNWMSGMVVMTWAFDVGGILVSTTARTPFTLLAMALIGMATAKAFEAGSVLQEEVDGLV